MNLQSLGYNIRLEKYRTENQLTSLKVGRIISEHKERYVVKTDTSDFDAELIGNLRFTAQDESDLPALGDWVAISEYDKDKALIHAIYPRSSVIERQAVGKFGKKQIIAANIDFGLVVQAIVRDFNLNRLERYLTICYASKVKPIIVFTKIDLINESALHTILDKVTRRIQGVSIIPTTNQSPKGYDQLIDILEEGKTYCLLGSSGVGKSTLLNNLLGKELMETGSISKSTSKGKHVTSHRELVVLGNGALLIDNPGMREVGIADTADGLETTFDLIFEFSTQCRYNDCTHIHEKGCAVLAAIEKGEIDRGSYENYLKMEREKRHFETSIKDKRKKDKDFGKLIKRYKKSWKENKY